MLTGEGAGGGEGRLDLAVPLAGVLQELEGGAGRWSSHPAALGLFPGVLTHGLAAKRSCWGAWAALVASGAGSIQQQGEE